MGYNSLATLNHDSVGEINEYRIEEKPAFVDSRRMRTSSDLYRGLRGGDPGISLIS